MPALSKKDPRYYVKQVPLPITPHTGIKIQARSDKVFNPTIPVRDDIRKLNYKRRQEQGASQGFQCPQHKPYRGIGDPFYLDHKKLILHALGQLEQTEQAESSDSSESENEEERVKQLQQQLQTKSFTTSNFFVRRTRKDLNTIPKKHQQGKELIRNVKLGHGLFYMLRRERQQKVEAEQRVARRRQEALKHDMQPPRRDSDSDADTEEDFDEDVELNEYMQTSTLFDDAEKETFLTETKPEDIAEQSFGADTSLPADSIKASRVAFQGVDNVEHEGTRVKSAKSTTHTLASSAKSSRRRGVPTRPYTPQHANIKRENYGEIDKHALFRQLCALSWLLEAMNMENPHMMAPISQCWSMREIGGVRGKDRKQEKERLDTTWKQFVSKQHTLKEPKKKSLKSITSCSSFLLPKVGSVAFLAAVGKFKHAAAQHVAGGRRSTNRLAAGGKPLGRRYTAARGHRNSVAASHVTSETPTGSVLNESIVVPAGQPNIRVNSAIPEGSEKESAHDTATVTEEEEENTYTKGLFRFLDEYYDSLRSKEHGAETHTSGPDDRQSNADGMSIYSARSEKRPSEQGGAAGRKGRPAVTGATPQVDTIPEFKDLTPQEISNILESIERSYLDPRLHKLSNPTERRTSKTMRADINVRPKSSPAVLEFKANLPSAKKCSMASDLRQGFVEVYQNKALILHDTLEALEREKFRKIQNKFVHLPTKGSSFHRAVDHMRSRSVAEEENLRESQRRQSLYQQWFTDLESNIPDRIKDDWYINKVLQRLQKYGVNDIGADGVVMMKQMEATKQSAFKLCSVLETLRDWEICSPDISAAIEFCREKIVEWSIEEFEEWFQQRFPKVVRPQTAPPACKREERDKKRRPEVPASAPPGRRAIKA